VTNSNARGIFISGLIIACTGQTLGHAFAVTAAVDQADHRRQDDQFGHCTQQDAAAGDGPSSAMPVKFVNPAAKKATAVVTAPVRIDGPTSNDVRTKASYTNSARRAIAGSGPNSNAVIDADADQRDGERNAEDFRCPTTSVT